MTSIYLELRLPPSPFQGFLQSGPRTQGLRPGLSCWTPSGSLLSRQKLAHATAERRLELREVVVHEPGIVGVVRRRPLHVAPERDQVVIAPVEGQIEEVLGQLRS